MKRITVALSLILLLLVGQAPPASAYDTVTSTLPLSWSRTMESHQYGHLPKCKVVYTHGEAYGYAFAQIKPMPGYENACYNMKDLSMVRVNVNYPVQSGYNCVLRPPGSTLPPGPEGWCLRGTDGTVMSRYPNAYLNNGYVEVKTANNDDKRRYRTYRP